MNHLLAPAVRPLLRWAESTQRDACRNAMVASTALAERRRERLEVEDYLDRTLGTRTHRAGTVSPTLPTARLG